MGGGNRNSGSKQAKATMEQARASVKAANINAAAIRDVARMELEGMQKQAEATMKAAKTSALGGVLGAALGAHQTTETIKQWLPHESGAAAVSSWELSEMWNKKIDMQQKGYSDVAIEYALSGNNYKSLYKDAQWNSLRMAQMARQDGMSAVAMFGIKSASNPTGVDVSEEQFLNLFAMKDPEEALKVDPVQSAIRQEQFKAWEADMQQKGLGMLVKLYKNPQLSGASILTMKGKDPLIDESMAPLVRAMMGDMDDENGDLAAAFEEATRGEDTPRAREIKKLMEMGVLDKYGFQNAGELLSHIPPELREPLEFNPYKELSPEQEALLRDTYRKYSEMVVDPKLVKETIMPNGVVRRTKFNVDGSVAGSYLEGMMTDMQGNQIYMAMTGDRMQDWMDRQSMISGMGPLFPGMLAPSTAEERNATFEPGFWGNDAFAKSNDGKVQGKTGDSLSSVPKMSSIYASTSKSSAPKTVTPDTNPAGSVGGAPLAAGE